jgi:DNA helicase-2/ATP-dependent DNA helicase PcrA
MLAVFRAYEERKRASNAMDYDDLLWKWLRLLEDAEFREAIRARFRHVLVDEYQDTNLLQGAIVDFMCRPGGSVTVVGDDAQSIYAWRGATAENILTFPERYPASRVFKLETNYRSTPEILELANRSIRANPRRFEKDLHPSRGAGVRPEVVPCRDAFQQSRFVAERMVRMHEDGVPLESMAVLYRAHWNALELQLELQRRDVPFRVRGGIRFFEQAHVKDVTAFLRVATNPADEVAWLRVLPLVPHVGLRTARSLVYALAEKPDPLRALGTKEVRALVSRRAHAGFRRFAEVVKGLARPAMRRSPSEMIRHAVDRFYGDYLAARFSNARAREEDLAQLALYAAQSESAEAFLAELAISGVVEAETSPVGPEEIEHVTLSTVHQAKGLEWPVVFVIWLADGRFPTDFAGRVAGGYEEERRLFHVAVTRAKDELVLAYPLTYRWRGREPVLMKRSRFLAEIDEPQPEPYDVVEIEEPVPSDFDLELEERAARAEAREIGAGAADGVPALPAPKKARQSRRAKRPKAGKKKRTKPKTKRPKKAKSAKRNRRNGRSGE